MSLEPTDDLTPRANAIFTPYCEGQKPLRVAAGSQPKKVAGAIAGQIRQTGCTELHAVGAEAVNQTVKSIALAKSYLVDDQIALDIDIDFMNVEINGSIRNGMRFCIKKRAAATPPST